MKFLTVLSLLSYQLPLAAASTIPTGLSKRAAQYNATLLAYGTSTDAWPVAYGLDDAKLYVTANPNDTTANLVPLTWDIAAITGRNWIANATFSNGTEAGSMYIMQQDFDAVGVSPIANIANVNGSVSGFAMFASQLVYNNNSTLESQFWAQSTDTDDVYALMWNTEGELQNNSFPVTIKATSDSS